ncbi:MAG TPA: M48 family metalloprotease [Terriglobales bacterium]|nr:M48 family metalloprotease [Terriglobales bacterium]
MRTPSVKTIGLSFSVLLCLAWAVWLGAQETSITPEIPDKFQWDMQTAARLRPTLASQSTAASGRYATGRRVFENLFQQVGPTPGLKATWELRITNDDLLNAFASPDGTIYVGRGLALLAGQNDGLWAAILSHEIAHVVRRDWARRYLYEKSLQCSGATLVLGDPGLPSGTWMDTGKASADLASFCRQMEVDADAAGLMLMARAGYHPDFVPALHHLLHAQSTSRTSTSVYAMHPCWETRDRQLERAYTAARGEFERLWPDGYASPGGNPPIVVFAGEPTLKKTGSKEWEVRVPMQCQNLAGAVEVVLLTHLTREATAASDHRLPASSAELRQLTGCTSLKTLITFTLTEGSQVKKISDPWAVYILDDSGSVLSRAEIPKFGP